MIDIIGKNQWDLYFVPASGKKKNKIVADRIIINPFCLLDNFIERAIIRREFTKC